MCGVVGLIGAPEAAREAFLGLTTLQHRGQDAAGILSYDADGFHRVKNLGLVESVFTRALGLGRPQAELRSSSSYLPKAPGGPHARIMGRGLAQSVLAL